MNANVNNNENVNVVANNTIINGEIFIIPNELATPKDLGWCDPKGWENFKKSEQSRLDQFNLTVEDRMVEIWAHNDACENFSCHLGDYEEMTNPRVDNQCRFPRFLPVSLFNGKKEGDTITLHREDGLVINLKLNQLDYRYGRFGKIEEVLENLIKASEKL